MANSACIPDPVALTADIRRAHPRGYRPHKLSAALLVALAALSLLLAACSQSAPATSGSQSQQPAPATSGNQSQQSATGATGSPVKVYFSKHPDSDSNPTAVFAVTRVAPNPQVATYAIQQLISGPTADESASGFYTTLGGWQSSVSNCSGPDLILTLNMKGTRAEQGTATLKFCRTVLLGGDLSGARISAEIEATLLQFATIHKVVILTPQGTCWDDFSGLNLCLR
jgi:spore germination protein GerM